MFLCLVGLSIAVFGGQEECWFLERGVIAGGSSLFVGILLLIAGVFPIIAGALLLIAGKSSIIADLSIF